MATINQLSAVSSVKSGDQVAVYSQSNGDARKAAMSVLLAYMQANLNLSVTDLYTVQYAAPSSSGFDVAITPGSESIHLILTPTGAFAAGQVTLPVSTGLVDQQEVLVNCTQAVSSFTIGANGASGVLGAPTALAANGFFRLKYDAATSNWYRVG